MNTTIPAGLTTLQQSDKDGVQAIYGAVCYCSGTHILTVRGEVKVEDLRLGDHVVTSSGAHRKIRWIGHRLIDCLTHANPTQVQPIRIKAGAISKNRPARDLLISPGHAICIDVLGEVLIPAIALVNGTTITQENTATVIYWHIELDSHDILFAEGQPAESYLDMGNRDFFAESDVISLCGSPDAVSGTHADAQFSRPFHADGPFVQVVRAQLEIRAKRLGWQLINEPWADLHLEVDGRWIAPDVYGLVARFPIPASATNIWIVSATSVPRDIGINADPRRLGLCLKGIAIDDAESATRIIALDDPLLCDGFHDFEQSGHRWTTGRSCVPAALLRGCRGTVFLRLELARTALPRWLPVELGRHEDQHQAAQAA